MTVYGRQIQTHTMQATFRSNFSPLESVSGTFNLSGDVYLCNKDFIFPFHFHKPVQHLMRAQTSVKGWLFFLGRERRGPDAFNCPLPPSLLSLSLSAQLPSLPSCPPSLPIVSSDPFSAVAILPYPTLSLWVCVAQFEIRCTQEHADGMCTHSAISGSGQPLPSHLHPHPLSLR